MFIIIVIITKYYHYQPDYYDYHDYDSDYLAEDRVEGVRLRRPRPGGAGPEPWEVLQR